MFTALWGSQPIAFWRSKLFFFKKPCSHNENTQFSRLLSPFQNVKHLFISLTDIFVFGDHWMPLIQRVEDRGGHANYGKKKTRVLSSCFILPHSFWGFRISNPWLTIFLKTLLNELSILGRLRHWQLILKIPYISSFSVYSFIQKHFSNYILCWSYLYCCSAENAGWIHPLLGEHTTHVTV